jgi:ribonuclease P/MRP protein subunit RPP40
MKSVLVPRLGVNNRTGLLKEDIATDLLEYLHMVALESPRMHKGDDMDPHLSRYNVPDLGNGVTSKNLVCLRWRGFIPPVFVRDLFVAMTKESLKGKKNANEVGDVVMGESRGDQWPGGKEDERDEMWFCMSAQAFGGKKNWTVIQFAERETLTWEVES